MPKCKNCGHSFGTLRFLFVHDELCKECESKEEAQGYSTPTATVNNESEGVVTNEAQQCQPTTPEERSIYDNTTKKIVKVLKYVLILKNPPSPQNSQFYVSEVFKSLLPEVEDSKKIPTKLIVTDKYSDEMYIATAALFQSRRDGIDIDLHDVLTRAFEDADGGRGTLIKCYKKEYVADTPDVGRSKDIDWKCDGCGQQLITDSKYARAKVECPKCKKPLVVPSSSIFANKEELAEPKPKSVIKEKKSEESEGSKTDQFVSSDAFQCKNCGKMLRDPMIAMYRYVLKTGGSVYGAVRCGYCGAIYNAYDVAGVTPP